MQQPPNPYQQYPQQQWQQSPMPTQQQWNPQQPPFPPQQYLQQPQYQPPMPPPNKKSRKRLWLILAAIVLVLAVIIGVASQGQSQQQAPATQATQQPTTQTTAQPTRVPATPTRAASSDTSQANDFIKLVQIVPVYGKVTDATLTPHGQGKVGVGFDVTITNPTQSRVKHVAYEILSTIMQVSTVDGANIAFHANGYTGMDDPIASDGSVSGEVVNWAALDDNTAWNATGGIFDANLPS